MSILLIFTHPDSIAGMPHELEKRDDVRSLSLTPIIHFDEDSNVFVAHKGKMESGLFFVSDSHSESQKSLVDQLPQNRSDVFVLKHQSPYYTIDGAKVEVGHHITGDRFYQPVFDVLIDDQHDKVSRILEIVFPQVLSSKLKLLHDCLIPQNAPRNLPKDLEVQYEDTYQEFWEASGGGLGDETLTHPDPFDPAYIAALSRLRDALLA